MRRTKDEPVTATPHVIQRVNTGKLLPALAVRLYPPPTPRALAFTALKSRISIGWEPVDDDITLWLPQGKQYHASVLLPRPGRLTINGQVVFDADVPALDPPYDLWIDLAQRLGRVLLYVGGPAPLDSLDGLVEASRQKTLIGAWATFSSYVPRTAGASELTAAEWEEIARLAKARDITPGDVVRRALADWREAQTDHA